MGYEIKPGVRYRMPVVFGPSCSPRQKYDGTVWTLEETGIADITWTTVRYRTHAAKLEALMPPGFALRGDPIVSVSYNRFENLYWLAGRGYGIVFVSFPITYVGKTERFEGSFCPVLWEGQPDAIMTGREELGFAKLFANTPEPVWTADGSGFHAETSWFDHTFFEMNVSNLVEVGGAPVWPEAHDGPCLFYKFMPRTSVFGAEGADIAYATTSVPAPGGPTPPAAIDFLEFKRFRGEGSVTWHPTTFEQIPMAFHVVNGMADLDILEVVEVEMAKMKVPGLFVAGNAQRAIEPA